MWPVPGSYYLSSKYLPTSGVPVSTPTTARSHRGLICGQVSQKNLRRPACWSSRRRGQRPGLVWLGLIRPDLIRFGLADPVRGLSDAWPVRYLTCQSMACQIPSLSNCELAGGCVCVNIDATASASTSAGPGSDARAGRVGGYVDTASVVSSIRPAGVETVRLCGRGTGRTRRSGAGGFTTPAGGCRTANDWEAVWNKLGWRVRRVGGRGKSRRMKGGADDAGLWACG